MPDTTDAVPASPVQWVLVPVRERAERLALQLLARATWFCVNPAPDGHGWTFGLRDDPAALQLARDAAENTSGTGAKSLVMRVTPEVEAEARLDERAIEVRFRRQADRPGGVGAAQSTHYDLASMTHRFRRLFVPDAEQRAADVWVELMSRRHEAAKRTSPTSALTAERSGE